MLFPIIFKNKLKNNIIKRNEWFLKKEIKNMTLRDQNGRIKKARVKKNWKDI